MQRESDAVTQLRVAFSERAAGTGVLLRWRAPRRRSDVGLVYLRGERDVVLGLPMKLLDIAVGFDLEIIRSEGAKDRYLLVLAVTESIERQPTHSPERRAKLRRRLLQEGAAQADLGE